MVLKFLRKKLMFEIIGESLIMKKPIPNFDDFIGRHVLGLMILNAFHNSSYFHAAKIIFFHHFILNWNYPRHIVPFLKNIRFKLGFYEKLIIIGVVQKDHTDISKKYFSPIMSHLRCITSYMTSFCCFMIMPLINHCLKHLNLFLRIVEHGWCSSTWSWKIFDKIS